MDFYVEKNIAKVGDKLAMRVFIHQCQDSSELGPNYMTIITLVL